MDDDKSLLGTITNTVKGAARVVAEGAKAIAHPTSGTPMDMPLNESGYAITHLHSTEAPTTGKAVKKRSRNSVKKAAKKSPKKAVKRSPTKKSKKTAKKTIKKATKTIPKKKARQAKR
jgi:hypothetical protein